MPTIHLTSDPSSKALPWTLTLDENGTAAPHACTDWDVIALAEFRPPSWPHGEALSLAEALADPGHAIGLCPHVWVRDGDPATYLAPVGEIRIEN